MCEYECNSDEVLKNCGCVSFHMPRANDTKICGLARVRTCVEMVPRAQCGCLPPCSDLRYSIRFDKTSNDHRLANIEIPER